MSETGKTKILIVEDDPDAAESMKVVLESGGYQVLHALDPVDGLAKVRAERPGMVLLDVMMPTGTEGFHFVWELRQDADEGVKKTPIIVTSAIHQTTKLRLYPDQSDKDYEPYEYLPVQGFLDKPVDFKKLLEEVRLVLEGKGANPV